MARRTWHRLFRSIFGSFNFRRNPIARLKTSRLALERLEHREVPAAAINQSLVILSPDIAPSVPREEFAGSRVVILDAGKDAVSQIGQALQANPGASVVRVISHGNSGSLLLAGQLVSGATLQARSVEVAGWRQNLAPGADLLLYGCSVASTADGRNFVNTLGKLTGADVAASTNTTGSARLGGDMALEYATGKIQAKSTNFTRAWNQSGLTLAAPVFSSAPTATFTNTIPGSFPTAATGSPTYSIAQQTFFDTNFSTLPNNWTLSGNAEISGGSCVLNPAGNSKSGALILPKLGASSPGSFTATFDYETNPTGGGNGTSFNYGIITLPNGNYQNGLVATGPNNGLSVNFIELAGSPGPRIDVTWGGTIVGSAPITYASTPKSVEIKLDGANILTVRYDGVEKLRMNLAGKVNALDRSNWQFAFGSGTGATTNSRHAIDNLNITSNGVLPTGLSLDSNTGVISGTPTTANNPGTQVFNLVASNADGATNQLFALKLESGTPVFTSSATNTMLPGIDGTFTVSASGTAGPTTYGVGRTIVSTTLADTTTLPAGAYTTGSALFNNGALELTQNFPSQTGRLQFVGEGAQNPNSFSASFNYKLGGGTTVGADNLSFFYGGPGTTSSGIYLKITEFTAGTGGAPGNNTNLVLAVYNNGNAISVGNAFGALGNNTVAFPNPYLPSASGYNFLPVRLNMSAEGRLQVYINNVLAFDAGNIPNWQTIDKSFWAFGISGTTSPTNNNFHTIKDLTIATTGVVPPGMTFDTTTGVLSGKLAVGNSVDSYLPITATNAAGTTNQTLKIDVSASNLLPGQRPGNGASVGTPSTSTGNAVGVTGYQFRNLTAFAALTATGAVTVWGDSLNGGKQADAPTGTGYTTIVSSEKAFAALKNDGSIFAWGFSANGATGEPTGTGFQRIAASRNAFAALRSDGGITVWGNTAGGGLPYSSASAAPAGIIYPPTNTGFIRLFANGAGFSAQRPDGTIVAWGNCTSTAASVTAGRPDPTWTFGNRIVPNDYATTTPTTGTTPTIGAFAGVRLTTGNNNIATWGSSLTGFATDAPGKYALYNAVDIVATSRAFAEMDINGQIISWGDSNYGGAVGGVPLSPSESGYRQIYANNGAFVAVRQDGSLKAWGSSTSGGTGAPTGTGYTQVFSTLNAFAALKANGSITVWGHSDFGGDPTGPPASSVTGYITIASTNSAFAALKNDGSIFVWGNANEGGKSGPTGTDWVEITSNQKSFTARRRNGTVFTWGGALTAPSVSNSNFLTVQSPTLTAPYFPLAAGAPVSFRIDQREVTQIFPGIQGDGLNFSISSGSLPPGMSFDPVTSYIYGAAAKSGTYPFTIEAKGPAGSLSQSFTLTVQSATLPNERPGTGVAYSIGTGQQFPNSGAYAALGVNGTVTAWGNSATGGSGAPTGTGYTQIISSSQAFAALRNDGSISAWGSSASGGSNAPIGTGFRSIVATQNAFAALKADGSITAWGDSYGGGSNAPAGIGFTKIYAGYASFAAMKADGSITVWGDSTYFATGTPATTGFTKIFPNKNAYAALKSDGTITSWGLKTKGGTGAPAATGYTNIIASDGAYAALRNDGTIAVWGDATRGGTNAPAGNNFVNVWSVPNGFAALRADGSIASWGDATATTNAPASAVTGFTDLFSTTRAFAALKADGSIVSWGDSMYGGSGAPAGTDYTQVFSNSTAFAALRADGSIAAWGSASGGGVGAPTGTGYTQIFSRANSFAAMKADGTVVSWGTNATGYPGLPLSTVQSATSVLPAFEAGLSGKTPTIASVSNGSNLSYGLSTIFAGYNGIAGLQVGAVGVGVGSAITSGNLPPGISLNVETGFLEGKATSANTYTFTVTSYNESGQTSQNFTLVSIDSTGTVAPDWQTKSRGYANFSIGQAVSYNLAVVAPTPTALPTPPNTYYQVVAGSLPPGLSLAEKTGVVSGTPTVPGIYQFTLSATTAVGTTAQLFTIAVNDGTLPSERIGQGSGSSVNSTGRQGLNTQAFAALQPDGTIVTWGDRAWGGAGAAGVPTENGYVQIYQSFKAFAALRQDGSIRSWGDSGFGGTGAPTGTGFTRVYSNYGAFAAIKPDGSITTWGEATSGGTGAPTGTGYTQIFTSSKVMAAMKADGSITTWGNASQGGTGAPAGTGYTTITNNQSAFAALKGDGSITAWGNTMYGGGTDAPTNNGYISIYSTPNNFAALRGDGTIRTWGITLSNEAPFPTGNNFNFVNVYSNNLSYAALKTDGSIVVWGNSFKGGTGGPTGTGFTAIYSTQNAFAALKADGSIVSWGTASHGGSFAPTGTGFTKIYSNAQAFVAMKADGLLQSWGNANFGGDNKAPTGTGFTQVFSSMQAFAAQKADGSISVWGNPLTGGLNGPTGTGISVGNNLATQPYYQTGGVTGRLPTAYVGTPVGPDGGAGVNAYQVGALGNGVWSRISNGSIPGLTLNPFTGLLSGTPTTAGTYTFTVTSSGSQGTLSQVFTLEVKGALDVLLPNQRVGSYQTLGGVYQNENAFATLKADGSITGWGNPYNGASATPTGTGYSQIVSSAGAFAALKADGSISAWGTPNFGGTGAPTGTGYAQVYAGYSAFAALKADGSITSWGELAAISGAPAGSGFTKVIGSLYAFAALKADGSVTSWGDSGYGGTGAPAGTGFTQVFSNSGAFAALKADGSITSWGSSNHGGTGAPTGTGYTQVFSSNGAFAALKADGSITAWGTPQEGATGAPSLTGYSSVVSSVQAFAALKFGGTNQYGFVTSWGNSDWGGTGAPAGNTYTKVSATRGAFAALRTDGSIGAWGNTFVGGGTSAPTGTGYTQIVSTSSAFAALKADGSISAWGDSIYGGGTDAPTGTGFTQLFSNGGAFSALKADGSITTWGDPNFGGTGAPAGTGFVTVQSSQASDPVFTGAPANGVLQAAQAGQPYFLGLGAQGVGARYELTAGSLPAGLTLDAATGLLSGTPTGSGTYLFSMAASSPAGTTARNLSLSVASAPTFTSTSSATFTAGTPVNFTVAATGSTSPFSYTGALPTGLSFDPATGVISGTPAAGSGGVANIVVTASNGTGSATQALALTVNEAPSFTNGTSATFTDAGSGNTFPFTARGFPAPTFTVISGNEPFGVGMDGYNNLTGTPYPGTGGVYVLTVQAYNGIGQVALQEFTLTVYNKPIFISANSANFVQGQTGNFTVATLAYPAATYGLATGSNNLPPGLTLDSTTGVLGGAPTAPNGSYTVTVRATNSAGFTDQTLTIDIKGGTVSSFTPSHARGGAVVTLSGQQFTGATQVSFGGVPATSFTVVSDIQITATVPVGASTGIVSVVTPGGTVTSTSNFTVDAVPAPAIASIATDTGSSNSDGVTRNTDVSVSGTAEALAIVKVYDGATFLGSVSANGSGAWTLPSTGILSEGTHNLTATATDAAGNISAGSAVFALVIDTTAPTGTAIVSVADDTGPSATDRITQDTTPTLSGTTDAGSTVEVFANGVSVGLATVVGVNWTFVSGALADGLTSFTAKSTDKAGNVSVATLPTGVTVDTIAPNAPVIVSVAGASPIFTAGFVKDSAFTISGTGEAGSTIELWDGATSLGTVVANAQGQWSKSLTGVAEGSHAFKAQATDLAGNIGTASATTTVVVDLTVPGAPLFSGPSLSSSASTTLGGTTEAFGTVVVTIAGVDYRTTADSSGNWELNLATAGVALAEGSNSLVLKAIDRGGNGGSTTTGNVTVDTIAPTLVFDAVTGDDRISKAELAGTIILSGTNEAGATVAISLGASNPQATVTGTAWTYTLTSAEVTALGSATTTSISVIATDTAGNTTTKTRVVSTSNVVAPGTPVLLAADDTGVRDNITSNQVVRIDVGGLANAAVGNLLRLVDGSGATLAQFTLDATAISNGTHQFTVGSVNNPLDEGSYTISAVTVDASTNDKATSAGSLVLIIDRRIPGAPSTPDLIAAHDTGSSNSDNITSKNSSLSFEVRLPNQVPLAKVGDTLRLYRDLTNNGPTTADDTVVASLVLTSLTNPQTLTLAATTLPNGTYYYYSRLFVAATNSLGTASNRIEVVIDNDPPPTSGVPVLLAAFDSGVSNSDKITSAHLPKVSVSLSGTGAVAGDRVDVLRGGTVLGGVEITQADIANNSVEVQFDQPLTEGANTLSARLTDKAGNASANSATATFTLDTIQPGAATIDPLDAASDTGASDNLTRNTSPSFSGTAEAGAIVDLFDKASNTVIGAAMVADSSGNWTITVSPALAQGTYSVVARVTDPAGNAAADSATVKLEIDTTAPLAPAVDLPAAEDTGVSDSDNITSATVLDLAGTTDPFAVVELFNGSTSLGTTTADSNGAWVFVAGGTTPLAAGTYLFSAKSTDVAGNVSLAGAVLSVLVDTAAPGTPSGISIADNTGSSNSDKITSDKTITVTGTTDANARVVLVDAQKRSVSTTANGSGAFSLTTADLADGAQALVLTVTDLAGNTNAGTTISLTVDTTSTAPVLSSASANLVNGVFGVTVTFPEDVTGFASTDITLTNGTLGNFVAVSARVYTFDVTPAADGAVTVSVGAGAADDTAGNSSLAGNTLTRTFDGTAPTVTQFSTTAPTPTNAAFTVNVAFSEIVTGFVASDVTVTNGTVGNFTGQGQNYSFTVTPAADGATTVKLLQGVATDAAGNGNTASGTISRTYDATAPTVALSTTAPARTNAPFTVTATFSESVSGFGPGGLTVVNASVSGLTGSGTTYSFLVTPTVDGTVSVTVLAGAASDAATNASAASGTLSRVYDATAPGLPVISGTIVTDTGSSSTDRITNDDDLALSGTAEANATVDVYDGPTLIGTISADGSGNWALASTGTLTGGLHAFTVKATDAAGNTGNAGLPLMVTIDKSAPGAPTIDLLAADDIGSSDSDNITAKSVLRLTGAAEASAVVEVFDGNTSLGTVTADAAGVWLFTTSTLSAATYSFKAQATDIAGNVSATMSGALSVVVDLTAPNDPANVTPTATSNPGDTLSGTAEANAKVMLTIASTTYTTTANGSGNWSLNLSAKGVSLAAGANTIGLQATDVAGNSSAGTGTATVTFTAPNMRVDAGSDTGRSTSDGVTSNTLPTFTGTTGAGYAVDLYEIISNSRFYRGSTTANGSGAWSVALVSSLADGSHTFVAVITPYSSGVPSGSPFDSALVTIGVDSSAPTASAVDLLAADDTGVSNSDDLTNKTAFRLAGVAEAFAIVEVFNGSTSLGSVTADGQGNWNFVTPTLSDATYQFKTKATDIAGNTSGFGTAVPVVVDLAAPSAATGVAIISDTGISSSDFITSDSTLDISGTTEAGALVLLTDDLNRSVSTTADSSGAFTLSNAALADGPHALKLTITDTAGNTNAGTIYNIVVDTVSPTVSLSTAAADPTNLNPFTVTATFAEAVNGLALGDISVTNGTAQNLSGSGSVYTFEVVPAADGKVEVSIGANAADDTAGNSSVASNTLVRVYDGTAPTVALTTTATPATKAPFTVTATFSEAVTGLVVGDITATNGATVGTFTAVSATVYTFVITPTAQGQVDVSIATGMAIDAASNGNVASATLSRVYDTVAPGVSLSSAAADPTNGSFTVTATFTEPVFGFDLGDLNMVNATVGSLTGSGTTYNFVVSAVADGTVSVEVKNVGVLDAASNGNTATSAPLTRVVDTARPQATISSTSATLVNAAFSVNIDFTEPVSGLSASDFTVTGGTAGTLTGSGKAYQLTVNPAAIPSGQPSSTVTISLPANSANDAAGNLNTSTNSISRTFDDINPTASVSVGFYNSVSKTYPTTVTFSEPVTGFGLNDLTLSGLNPSNLQGSGTTYTFDLALVGNNNNTIAVGAGAASDSAGNPSDASPTVTIVSDIISPTATMTASAPYVNIANKSGGFFITVTLTDPSNGTDPISGLAPASFPATLSSTSPVTITYKANSYTSLATSGSATSKASATYTVVPTTPNGWLDLTGTTVVASIGSSAYADVAGNAGAVDASAQFKVDVVAPELITANRTTPVRTSEEFTAVDMLFSERVFNVSGSGIGVTRTTNAGTTGVSLGAAMVQAVGTGGDSYRMTGITQANTRPGGTYAFSIPASTAIVDEAGNKAVVSGVLGSWDQIDYGARAKISSTLPSLTNSPVLPITVSFGRPMKNLTSAGIAVLNENNQNVTGSVTITSFTRSADGKQYSFNLDLGANALPRTIGKFTILVVDGTAVSDDPDELPCGFSESKVFTIDRIPPVVSLVPWPGQFTDGGKSNLSRLFYKAVFDQPVSSVPRNFVLLNPGAGNVTSVSAIAGTGMREWFITVSPKLTGNTVQQVTARLATGIYTDAAGNNNDPSNTVVVDVKRNLAITPTLGRGLNSATGYNYSVGKLTDLTVRFSDIVDPATITSAAFKVSGGTVTNIRLDNDMKGAKFDLVFANQPYTRFTLSVAMQPGVVRDTYGNVALGSAPLSWVIDGQAPVATMTGVARIRLGATASVAVAFTDIVQPLNLSMFDVSFTPAGGTEAQVPVNSLTLRGSTTAWSISYKPTTRGTLTVRLKIDADGPKDLLGNALQIPAGFQVVVV